MTAAGLIFSNIHDASVPELTRNRTMASIPFGARYRLVDFALSNMVGAGITKVGLITHYNYGSLLDHVGNGKDWDLARRSGGLKILPPFITAYDNNVAARVYHTRLEALMGVMNFIHRCTEQTLVLSDCDVICNVDLTAALRRHAETGADVTLITATVDADLGMLDRHVQLPVVAEDGTVIDMTEYDGRHGHVEVSADMVLVRRTFLAEAVSDAMAHGKKSFTRDVLYRHLASGRVSAFRHEGFFARVNSLAGYFRCSMCLLDDAVRADLFGRRPVITKVRNSMPTRYLSTAAVRDSVVADGCVIEGTVEHSVLFRGVKIGKGTHVSHCILMQDTFTGENVRLKCVITDKNAMIKDGRELCGHETMPLYVGKGVMV